IGFGEVEVVFYVTAAAHNLGSAGAERRVPGITQQCAARRLESEIIARTETVTAVMYSKHEAFQQALSKSGRDATLVTRKWRSAGDRKVRHT
ncbi:hypothetical protein ACC753_37150, partial [Rhizobium ruizarguesonis]